MKKILASLLTIGVVSVGAVYSTAAYFSDTEVSTDNTFTAGTIDIAVDGENPWESTAEYVFENMLPGDTETISVPVANVGNNELVLWKKVRVTDTETGVQSEPECEAELGVWDDSSHSCSGMTAEDNNLPGSLNYEMIVGGTTLIDPVWEVKVEDVNDLWVPLGRVAVGDSITVEQNYYFDEEAGNVLQGDSTTFDIVFYAEQIGGTGPVHTTRGIVMDNKTAATDWLPIVDGTLGIMTWDGSGNYHLRAWGLDNSQTYRVAYYDGTSEVGVDTYRAPTAGELDYTGTYAGFNTNVAAKYWLRPANWDNVLSLWEANLVN
jgi:predicted ribosomally synthesized peptide with SipW-like signal peptide